MRAGSLSSPRRAARLLPTTKFRIIRSLYVMVGSFLPSLAGRQRIPRRCRLNLDVTDVAHKEADLPIDRRESYKSYTLRSAAR